MKKNIFHLRISSNILLFLFLLICTPSIGQTAQWANSRAIQDSIEILSNHNSSLKKSIENLIDSAKIANQRHFELEKINDELASRYYNIGQSIFTLHVGGGLAPFQYKPDIGKRNNGFGFVTGLSYSYFLLPDWGVKLGLSLDRYGSLLTIDNIETSTPSIDGGTDNDGQPDPFDLLTRYNGFKEKQNALLIGTALQVSYREELTEKWDFIGSMGPKFSFVAKSQSYVSEGSYTTSGYYPQYGLDAILPGPGFKTYAPTERYKNDMGVGFSLLTDLDFAYKFNQGFALLIGTYFDFQLNSKKINGNQSLVTYEVDSPTSANSVYHSLFNSNSINKINRYAVGIKIGVNFDVGGYRNHKKVKNILKNREQSEQYAHQSIFYNEQAQKEIEDSQANTNRIEELQQLLK